MLFLADIRLAGAMRLVDEPLVAKRIHGGQQTNDPWHTIYSLESRTDWCRQRSDALGEELSSQLADMLGKRMIRFLEDRYWRRELDGFCDMRSRVAERFPELVASNCVINRRIYPQWVYALRDAVMNTKRG